MRFSVIVVTAGRDTLPRTLQSIATQTIHGDEVLVVGHSDFIRGTAEAFGYRYIEDGPFGCWGQRERQAAMAYATGTHLLFMDDDDVYLPGAFRAIREAVETQPDRPQMFRMVTPEGFRIWSSPTVVCGNVSGTQFVTPNDPAKLGTWGLRREGDFDFITSTLAHYPADALIWHTTFIATCRPQTNAFEACA
jgi:glycosyltransferase involved in cell wall biosynthesis